MNKIPCASQKTEVKSLPADICVFDRFGSTVCKRGAHSQQSFLMVKCSCKVVNTLPSDIFRVSAISLKFNLRSDKTIFFMFSETTDEFGPPERSASSVFICDKLKIYIS